MKKKLFCGLLLLVVVMSVTLFMKKEDTGTELVIFAASSLTEALTEAVEEYEAESGVKLICTFESSGTLEKQLESGAVCDIFLSASQKQSEALSPLFLEPPIPFLENKVVLAVSQENPKSITGFSDVTKDSTQLIAIGSSDAPIGQYAQEIFENLNLWQELQGKISFAANAKEVTAQVKEGVVDCGVVYDTDATSAGLKVAATASNTMLKTPVIYTAAIPKISVQPTAAKDFLDFLTSPKIQAVFEKTGFSIPKIKE